MSRSRRPAAIHAAAIPLTTALLAAMLSATTVASAGTATAAAPAQAAPSATVASEGVVGGLEVENSFVSAVGWVKPGDTYPSRVIVRNTSGASVTGASVTVAAPVGSTIVKAGTTTVEGGTYTWQVGSLAAGATRTLVLESRAATLAQLPTVVWRDLSTTATVTVGGATKALTSHGPKVVPPGSEYDTARYGDRPFPVVPVAYTDRDYGTHDRSLDTVINDPSYEGSTFNLYQEMSIGQLYPEGTVPSAGVATADFAYPGNTATGGAKAFPFTKVVPGQTCAGVTYADSPLPAQGTPLYPVVDALGHHGLLRLGRQRLGRDRLARRCRRPAADRLGLRPHRQARRGRCGHRRPGDRLLRLRHRQGRRRGLLHGRLRRMRWQRLVPAQHRGV
jgi:hypothetical protein